MPNYPTQAGDGATSLSRFPGIAVAGRSGTASTLDVSVPTVIKALPGRLIRIVVKTSGSFVGGAFDCATMAAIGVASQFAVI